MCSLAYSYLRDIIYDSAPGRSQSPPPPPWIQKQRAQSLEQQLKQTKLAEQSSLQQQGISNPLEMEFTEVVRPIMEACTKDAIAVRHSYWFCFCCDSPSLSLPLILSPFLLSPSSHPLPAKAGKGWIFSQAVTMDECRQVARFIMRKWGHMFDHFSSIFILPTFSFSLSVSLSPHPNHGHAPQTSGRYLLPVLILHKNYISFT